MAETISKITGLPADAVVPDADLVDDLCVDSVAKIELMVACEARYGIQVPDDVVSRFRTVRSVLDYLMETGS
jgi:acyl carrier protein